jgi:plasmid stabilization system protein ParE
VFYVADANAITVLRILHGQRDVPALLQGEAGPEDEGD